MIELNLFTSINFRVLVSCFLVGIDYSNFIICLKILSMGCKFVWFEKMNNSMIVHHPSLQENNSEMNAI